MANNLLLFDKPVALEESPPTVMSLSGDFSQYTPGNSYSSSIDIVNQYGKCRVVVLPDTVLPSGARVVIDNVFNKVYIKWDIAETFATIIPNGDFESGLDNWIPDGGGWVVITDHHNGGAQCVANSNFFGLTAIAHAQLFGCAPGDSITLTCQVDPGDSSKDAVGARAVLVWKDHLGFTIGFDGGNEVNDGPSGTFIPSSVTAVAPPDTAYVTPAVSSNRWRQNSPIYVDDVSWNFEYVTNPLAISYPVHLEVIDSLNRSVFYTGAITKEFALVGTFPDAPLGTVYNASLSIVGGAGSGSYSNPRVITGTLPSWATLGLSGDTLTLSGTPTGSEETVSITVAVDSSNGQIATSDQSFDVFAANYSTLDPSYTASGLTLSNGNRTAYSTTGITGLTRGTTPITVPTYFEFGTDVLQGTGAVNASGICTGDELVTAPLGYSSANGWAIWTDGPGLRHSGVTLINANDFHPTEAGRIGIAVDPINGFAWFRYNGVWLGDGSPDPATGTAPNYTGLTGDIYPACCPWGQDNQITFFPNPSDFADPAPAGFSASTT